MNGIAGEGASGINASDIYALVVTFYISLFRYPVDIFSDEYLSGAPFGSNLIPFSTRMRLLLLDPILRDFFTKCLRTLYWYSSRYRLDTAQKILDHPFLKKYWKLAEDERGGPFKVSKEQQRALRNLVPTAVPPVAGDDGLAAFVDDVEARTVAIRGISRHFFILKSYKDF